MIGSASPTAGRGLILSHPLRPFFTSRQLKRTQSMQGSPSCFLILETSPSLTPCGSSDPQSTPGRRAQGGCALSQASRLSSRDLALPTRPEVQAAPGLTPSRVASRFLHETDFIPEHLHMVAQCVSGTDLDQTYELSHNVKMPYSHPATHHSQHQVPLGHQPQVFQSLNRHLPTRQRI